MVIIFSGKISGKIIKAIFLLKATLLFLFLTITTIYATEPIGSWSSTQALPYLLASHASLSSANKVLVIGGSAVTGQSKFDVISSTINSDGSLSSWGSVSSPIPSALIWHSLAKKGNNVYILGGREENPGSSLSHVNLVFLGNLNENGQITSWSSLNPLPKNLSLGATVLVGNRIYYAGGFNDSETNQKIYVTPINPDATIGTWSEAGDLPLPLFGFGIIEHNNNIYIIGGYNPNSGLTSKVYKYTVNENGTLSGPQELNEVPLPSYRAGVIKIGSKILIIGGGAVGDKVYYADINNDTTIGSWTLSQHKLPQVVGAAAVAVSDKYIYLTGGFNGAYLDTVYYSKINASNILDVPLLKQTSNPWQSQTYDTANLWNPSNPTINPWGCALTSAAMVFQFHGIKKLPDGTTLDPGTLNRWLNSQRDGYIRNGLLNWLALSRLSRLAKAVNGLPFNALEYSRVHGENKPQLTEDISNSIPDILEEPEHFIVGKGINGTTFDINDPFYNRATLNDGYSNTFLSLGRYVPTSTDLSYILLVVDQNITIELKDSNGNSIGEQFLQQPLINDVNGTGSSGQTLKIVYFKKPPSGNYQLLLSSPNNSLYKLEIYLYDQNGEVKLMNQEGIVGNSNKDTIGINFNKQNSNNSYSQKTVTFQSAISDVNELRSLKLIKINSLAKEIITLLTSAERDAKRGKKLLATKKLQAIIPILNGNRGGGLTEGAYQIILYDVNYLINHL